MAVFADTSAGVKRYLDEPGADLVRTMPDLLLSALTRVELPSAIWRKERDGVLSLDEVGDVLDAFIVDWHGTPTREPAVAVIALDGPVLVRAAQLTGLHGLRAGDAIQLASALTGRRADPTITDFVCFDRRLREAAAREDFRLVPAEL